MSPKISPYGDHALYVKWPSDGYSEAVNMAVLDLAKNLRESGKYIDVVPAYDSLVCVFDLGTYQMKDIKRHVEDTLIRGKTQTSKAGKIIDIPVHYGGADGPDMQTICAHSGLSEAEVIHRHSQDSYRVCMMGFIPGFTFLSPAPDALHHPRLATPRAAFPAGSIGIANWQTGIYGLSSPGGWQIIGRTPLSIFDGKRDTPFLLQAGDQVRFIPQ